MAKKSAKRKKTSQTQRSKILFERVMVYLIALFVFALPLFIWPGSTEYGYDKSIFALIGISILLILWGGSTWLKGEWRIRLPFITFPALGLILVSLLSLIHAINGRVVIQSLTLLTFFFLFYLVVTNLVKDKRDVTLILYCLLLSSFLASLYGLLQYLGVMLGASGGHGLGAMISTMGNRNYLGGFLSYLFFPAAILVGRLRRLWSRALAVAGVGFVLAMVLFLQQTGTQLGLVAGALFLLIGLGLWPQVSYLRRAWPWWAGIGGICLAAVGIVLGPSTLGIGLLLFIILGAGSYGLGWAFRRWRWTWVPTLGVGLVMLFLLIPFTTPFTAVERTWEQNSGRVRSWDWWVGWEMFKDHPIVGVGLGNYKLNFIPYKAKFLASPQGASYNFPIARAAQAHNEYVQMTAELGSLGILTLLALLITVPICFWIRLRRNLNEGDRFDLLLLSCGVVAFLVHALVSFPAHLPASCLVLVLVLGLASSRAYGEAAEVHVSLKKWPLKVFVTVLIAFCLLVSVIAARDFSADLLLNQGIKQLQMGQLRLAEATLERSARLDFCPRQTYYHLATAKIKQGQYEEARVNLELCRTRFVVENLYLNLANLAVNLGDLETARQNVELLLATHPHPTLQIQAEYLEGIITIQEGDYNRAADMLETLIQEHPTFERSYIALGDLYRMRGMPVNARKNYEKALELIDEKLTKAKETLSSAISLPTQQYFRLHNEIEVLTQEKEAAEASLAKLPSP